MSGSRLIVSGLFSFTIMLIVARLLDKPRTPPLNLSLINPSHGASGSW